MLYVVLAAPTPPTRAARLSPVTWKQCVSEGVFTGSVVVRQAPLALTGWLILEITVWASFQCVVLVVGNGWPSARRVSVGPPVVVSSQLFVSTPLTVLERQARKLAKPSIKMAFVLAW